MHQYGSPTDEITTYNPSCLAAHGCAVIISSNNTDHDEQCGDDGGYSRKHIKRSVYAKEGRRFVGSALGDARHFYMLPAFPLDRGSNPVEDSRSTSIMVFMQ